MKTLISIISLVTLISVDYTIDKSTSYSVDKGTYTIVYETRPATKEELADKELKDRYREILNPLKPLNKAAREARRERIKKEVEK